MQNASIQATGEAMPAVTRRSFLHSTAGASVALAVVGSLGGAVGSSGAATPTDPLVALLTEYHRQDRIWWDASDAFPDDDAYDAFYVASVKPLFEKLRDDPPAATTEAGVIAALQFVADQEAEMPEWNASKSVTKAALAYFDRRAAQ